jgi:hypothetical protein
MQEAVQDTMKSLIGRPASISAKVMALRHAALRPPSDCSTSTTKSIWDLQEKGLGVRGW